MQPILSILNKNKARYRYYSGTLSERSKEVVLRSTLLMAWFRTPLWSLLFTKISQIVHPQLNYEHCKVEIQRPPSFSTHLEASNFNQGIVIQNISSVIVPVSSSSQKVQQYF